VIAIVTDSTAYFTKQEAHELGIRIVPLTYIIKGKEYFESYVDCNGDFEKLINESNGDCSTSQSTIFTYTNVFEELINEGFEVLCITLSSRLSGAYSSACIAAREVNPDKIHVFDSLSSVGGLYHLVKEARDMTLQDMKIEEILDKLEDIRQKIKICFSVDDISFLRNSGRVGIVRKSAGTILNMKPLFKVFNGSIVSDKTTRGRHEQIRQLLFNVPVDPYKVIVHYVSLSDVAMRFYKDLKRLLPNSIIEMRKIGPVISIHLGVDMIVLVSIDK